MWRVPRWRIPVGATNLGARRGMSTPTPTPSEHRAGPGRPGSESERVPVPGEDSLWEFGRYVMSPPSSEAQRVALTAHERPGFHFALWSVTVVGCIGIFVGGEALAWHNAKLRQAVRARDEGLEVERTRRRMEAIKGLEAAEAKEAAEATGAGKATGVGEARGVGEGRAVGAVWDEARLRAVVQEAVAEGIADLEARVGVLEEGGPKKRTWAGWARGEGRRDGT